MAPILELKNLNKRFGGITAVKDFDLQVEQRQIIGLIGPNGAGKTTLFNLITGFLKPDSGTISFNFEMISCLTLGSAFSFIVTPAVVCGI